MLLVNPINNAIVVSPSFEQKINGNFIKVLKAILLNCISLFLKFGTKKKKKNITFVDGYGEKEEQSEQSADKT